MYYFHFFKNMHWTKTMPYIFCYSLISYTQICHNAEEKFNAHFHKALWMTCSQCEHLQTTIVNNLIFCHYFWIDLDVLFTVLCGMITRTTIILLLKYNMLIWNVYLVALIQIALFIFFCDYWQNETSPRPLKRWPATVAPY